MTTVLAPATTLAQEAIDVDAMVAQAVAAQRAFADWSEPRVDALLRDVAAAIADHAAPLARATVAETGLGNVRDKTTKNKLASELIYRSLAGKPGSGLLRFDEDLGVAEIASPMGVVFGLVPRTHPVATFVFKVLIALKARNALILSCHRGAERVGARAGELIASVLEAHGAPPYLVQWISGRSGRETTLAFMHHPDVSFILATGGAKMVRAAYSSGTPAIGVGPGNAPTWICADADPDRVAKTIVASKSFDNGIVCASEHNLVVDRAIQPTLVRALERHGAAVLTADEPAAFVYTIFDSTDGHVRPEFVGQSAERIGALTDVRRPWPLRLIVVPARLDQADGPLGHEKLAPIASLFTVADDDEALALCRRLLASDGAGHTAIIHTHDQRRIDRFSQALPVSRILVNVAGTYGSIGLDTCLVPSMTLGTGTFGGTSTTDSVTYTHLMNVKRIAYRRSS
jgi:acyl-CoA reductase-like NAD-dependent aldehyde dehydrogenase